MRIIRTLLLTGSLIATAATMSGAWPKQAPAKKVSAKKTASAMVTCPIMKVKSAKSKAIKVTAANGKSTYVCCKACIAPAKKLLMTKKVASTTVTCPFMKKTVAKKDAIKVTAANGKSMYVCCAGCEAPAKKQLMAKK